MTKKNDQRATVQLKTDPELGQVLTWAPETLEEPTTPEPAMPESLPTTQVDTDEVRALIRQTGEHHTTQLSTTEIGSILESSVSQGEETLSLHRIPRQDLEDGETTRWSKEQVAHVLDDAKKEMRKAKEARSHRTEQISDLELGVIVGKPLSREGSEERGHFKDVDTVRWDVDDMSGIVTEAQAAAMLEVSSKREDDEALLDIPEKQVTESVTHEALDDIMDEAISRHPRQGRLGTPSTPLNVSAPPRVALLEERMPQKMERSMQGGYRSVPASRRMPDTPQSEIDTTSTVKKLALTLLVLVVAFAIANVLYMMWPKS